MSHFVVGIASRNKHVYNPFSLGFKPLQLHLIYLD